MDDWRDRAGDFMRREGENMITKPEDAVLRLGLVQISADGEMGPYGPVFTATECAEIAKAYADCVAAEIMTQGSHGDEWRAKFKEWEL